MSQLKKVLITVPESLLREVDKVCSSEQASRSEFVRAAMRAYLLEKQKLNLAKQLRQGYQEMAGINLTIADECFAAESEALSACEEKLAEREVCGS